MIELIADKNNKVVDGKFSFTEVQVKAILEMRLSKLTGLERENLSKEICELGEAITDYLETLHNKAKLMGIITDELEKIKEEYATPRKTEILDGDLGEVNIEDFIEKKDVLVSVSTGGYIKRTDLSSYRSQRRGGKGKKGMETLEDDSVAKIFVSHTHAAILFFTNKGKVFRIKTYQLPETAPNAKGRAIVNFIKMEPGDTLAETMPLPVDREEWKNYDLIFATKKGNVRRSSISDFENINSNGKIAISLDEDDKLISVQLAKHTDNVLLASKKGMATRFEVADLRIIKSRTSDGVRGMNLADGDEVVSMCILSGNENNSTKKDQFLSIDKELRLKIWERGFSDLEIQAQLAEICKKDGFTLVIDEIKKMIDEEQMLLTITSDGFGKRTSAYEYRITGRGGKGISNINLQEGAYVVMTAVADNTKDIIMITDNGQSIRIPANNVRVIGRNTKGVNVFTLKPGEKIASASILENDGDKDGEQE